MFNEIVLASNNEGKLKEFRNWFSKRDIVIHPQAQFNVPECPEPYHTFIENALTKARHASLHSGKPALADDSGICANALNGAPGVLSARFAGEHPKSDLANSQKMSLQLADKADKSCFYVCMLVLVRHVHDPHPIIAEGIWHGQWQENAKGNNGFGYDPHFFLPDRNCTAAELLPDIKNEISHRGLALKALELKINDLYPKNA